MVEVIIVILIVMILSAVAITRWNYDSVKRVSAARKVAGDIRYAQKLAVTTQSRSGIGFNANGYTVYRDAAALTIAQSPGDICSTNPAGQFVVDFTAQRCSDFSGVVIAPPAGVIAFNSMGTPVDTAGNPLAAQNITLTIGGNSVLTIEAGTGRVSY